MKWTRAAILLIGLSLLLQPRFATAQDKAPKVFFLEDTTKNQWCAFTSEATRDTAIQDTDAITAGTFIYSNDRLSQIDVIETDQTGDWTIYYHYFLDDHGQIIKLSRMINVLPGDRSVLQTFSISDGKATKTETTEKELSTGKILTSPEPVWLPESAIRTAVKAFPFSDLLGRQNLRTASKSCINAVSSPLGKAAAFDSVCGHWTIKRILTTSNVQASPDSLKHFLGQEATYFDSEMKFGDNSAKNLTYSMRVLSEREFFDQFRVPFKRLAIDGNSVAIVELSRSSGENIVAPGTLLLIRNKNAVITTWDGLFLEMTRTGASCPPSHTDF